MMNDKMMLNDMINFYRRRYDKFLKKMKGKRKKKLYQMQILSYTRKIIKR